MLQRVRRFSGIIGVSGPNSFGITGVANQASLAAYRVFGCKGSVDDDGRYVAVARVHVNAFIARLASPVLVSALLRAYDDSMDVITLSLGGADGWSESTTSILASRLAS